MIQAAFRKTLVLRDSGFANHFPAVRTMIFRGVSI
jgi:hypothetical protein